MFPPPGHWPGQCYYCHVSTSDWSIIVFDHSTYTDCKACHADDRPADHPHGQCSQCHSTDTCEISTDSDAVADIHTGVHRHAAAADGHPDAHPDRYFA